MDADLDEPTSGGAFSDTISVLGGLSGLTGVGAVTTGSGATTSRSLRSTMVVVLLGTLTGCETGTGAGVGAGTGVGAEGATTTGAVIGFDGVIDGFDGVIDGFDGVIDVLIGAPTMVTPGMDVGTATGIDGCT